MNWVTIDFEASCLPQHGRSFPIEVGVCGPFGTRSWLIRPVPEWQDWHWTEEAFRLHRIDRDMLDREGLDPAVVVAELRRAIGGSRVVSDSVLDRDWWETLQRAAGKTMSATPIALEHISEIFTELGVTDSQIDHGRRRADQLCPGRHRAGADARWLFTLLSDLSRPGAATELRPFPSWTAQDAYARSLSQPQRATENV